MRLARARSLGVSACQALECPEERAITEYLLKNQATLDGYGLAGLIQACARINSLPAGKKIHSVIASQGLQGNKSLGNHLINMYGRLGSPTDAFQAFHSIVEKNIVSHNAIITAFAQNGHFQQALLLFRSLLLLDPKMPNPVTFVSAIKACTSHLRNARWIRSLVAEVGFSKNLIIATALVNLFASCSSFEEAHSVFLEMEERNEITWSALISARASEPGNASQAWEIFEWMLRSGVAPNEITFISLLSACSSPEDLEIVERIHSSAQEHGVSSDIVVANSILNMYGKCGAIDRAREIFDSMPHRFSSPIAWNSLVGGYVQENRFREAIGLLQLMNLEGIRWTKMTFLAALNACAGLGEWGIRSALASNPGNEPQILTTFHQLQADGICPDPGIFTAALNSCTGLKLGEQIHSLVAEAGVESGEIFTAAIQMYARCGDLVRAREVFEELPVSLTDTITWNAIISGYLLHQMPHEAMKLFGEMQLEGIRPTKVVLLTALQAAAAMGSSSIPGLGDRLLEMIGECRLELDSVVGTAIIHMLVKTGDPEAAIEHFNRMRYRNVVTWNSMLSLSAGSEPELKVMLGRFLCEGMKPDRVTFLTLLSGCASLPMGQRIQGLVEETSGMCSDTVVLNALVTMYSRCGGMGVLDGLEGKMERFGDLITWNSVVAAYAQHGMLARAVEVTRMMEQRGFPADNITLTVVLSACSHAGMVEEGCGFYRLMVGECGVEATGDHHASVVDMFCRAGRLGEAEDLVSRVRGESRVGWSSLLGGCRFEGDVVRGQRAAERLLEVNPGNHGAYVMLAETYRG